MIATLLLTGASPAWAASDVSGIWVEMAKRGRVRYGPTTEAPTVTTLPPGTKVLLLGKASMAGQEDWYQIQFPRQGHAWMHKKVLTATDDPRVFRVSVDKARVRADSRIRAELVAQLALGDTVEWVGNEIDGKWVGRQVGDWYAIYPRSAVAYCHHSVLKLSQDILDQQDAQELANNEIERDWRQAKQDYQAYFKVLQTDQAKGLAQDWAGLADRLQGIIDAHPRMRTRLDADRLRKAIRRVLTVSKRVEQSGGTASIALLPELDEQPAEPVQQTPKQGTTTTQDQRDPPPVVEQQDPPAGKQDPPSDSQLTVKQPVLGQEHAGWLFQRDIPGSDAKHVLVDSDSKVVALVLLPADSSLSLAEFFWRHVAVKGSQQSVTVAIDGVEQTVPQVTVADIYMR